jgi:3-methyl-2-oxobutanoate hydroxymethyltransferase
MYANDAPVAPRRPMTVPMLRTMKQQGTPIVVLTAYDASMARIADAAGVDMVLVGDSLGMVVQGADSTLPVTIDDLIYHSRAVRRGLAHALMFVDMPFLSYATPERALDGAARLLMQGGASMVKLEGGGPEVLAAIEFLSKREVPVCAHLGLTPQSVLRLGGYKVQGREEPQRRAMLAQAQSVVAAGAEALVLECVPADLGQEITASIPIPTIGIGAGSGCDGQVLVCYDMLGMTLGHRRPRFVKDFLAGAGSAQKAIETYAADVRARRFPAAEHGY